ncbi:hypothetical protein LOK49_LG08G00572 [Camellia lanceoleosa]|uniref:Uncharacterized protein n=1 Tax=Camellia lanceoleosa TaxID=1840588 RepID=A0ACC0GW81_9ERIC|nr:hypothetical protein LOK49_LG08G00572 [Camellia lanceoleosa]
MKILINSSIPCTRSLLQSIKCFLQFVHFVFMPILNIPRRLFNIDFFFEKTIKKCRFHIKLINLPLVLGSQRNH